MSIKQAVILAGGLGTRLRPLTYEIPKPMVPVDGKPFLHHQIQMLKDQGFERILLLTGYLSDQIEAYFKDGAELGVAITYCQEREPLGTGGALVHALDHLEDRFILLYGDSYLPIDYQAFCQSWENPQHEALSILYDNQEHTDVKANMAVDASGTIILYQKDGDDPRLKYVDAGVSALSKEAIEGLKDEGKFNLEQVLFPKLIAKGALGSYATRQRFFDIGTPSRLSDIRSFFA